VVVLVLLLVAWWKKCRCWNDGCPCHYRGTERLKTTTKIDTVAILHGWLARATLLLAMLMMMIRLSSCWMGQKTLLLVDGLWRRLNRSNSKQVTVHPTLVALVSTAQVQAV